MQSITGEGCKKDYNGPGKNFSWLNGIIIIERNGIKLTRLEAYFRITFNSFIAAADILGLGVYFQCSCLDPEWHSVSYNRRNLARDVILKLLSHSFWSPVSERLDTGEIILSTKNIWLFHYQSQFKFEMTLHLSIWRHLSKMVLELPRRHLKAEGAFFFIAGRKVMDALYLQQELGLANTHKIFNSESGSHPFSISCHLWKLEGFSFMCSHVTFSEKHINTT